MPPSGKSAVIVYASNGFTCAVRNDTSTVCWGSNTFGQLGIGSTVSAVGLSNSGLGNAFQSVNLGTGIDRELCTKMPIV